MVDYLVVVFPHPSGGWAAVLPDFVGVTGRGTDMQQAFDRVVLGAREVCGAMVAINSALPEPGDLASAQSNHRWVKEYGVNWDEAVVRAVAISRPTNTPVRRAAKRESKVVAWSRRVAERSDRNAAFNPAAE